MDHTPTPWWINRTNGSEHEICSGPSGLDAESQSKIVTVAIAHGPQGEWGKVGAEHQANAAFIVRAVNAHDDLLGIVKIVLRLSLQKGNTELNERCKRAIAKAEGK